MAIYEFTNEQFNRIRGTWGAVDENARPHLRNFQIWRGVATGASAYNWPSNGHDSVESGCVIDKLRSAVGGMQFDMPTDSEWEFACRAGSSTKYCNGTTTADLAKVAWYEANDDGSPNEVGLKEPNAWGMYDMHGNCAEYCLDKCSKRTSDPVWDPTGPMEDEIILPTDNVSRYATIRGGGRWSNSYPKTNYGADACKSYSYAIFGFGESAASLRPTLVLNH
jgi:formylglycine-generating enzyme required for sulfatase activity